MMSAIFPQMVEGICWDATYQHFAILANLDTLTLDDLDILQTTENLVLNLERDDHRELRALFDLEWLVLKCSLTARLREVDRDGVAARRLHGQGMDDADAGVVGVRKVFAAAEAEGLLVALEGLIIRI